MEELTKELKEQALELYNNFKAEIEPLLNLKDKKNIEENIFWKVRHINCYEILDTYSDDELLVSISTDNTKDNSLQGIRCYIILENEIPTKISDYIDIYLCNDDYPFEVNIKELT